MIPDPIVQDLALLLGAPSAEALTAWRAVSGGSINHAYAFRCGADEYFVKFNLDAQYPGMFAAEAEGLRLLQACGARVPEVIATGASGAYAWLLQRTIVSGRRRDEFEPYFGRMLAELHRHSAAAFGSMPDNWIGSLPQRNENRSRWSDFFRELRLDPMLRQAVSMHALPAEALTLADGLYARLGEWFPEEPPALLHGDCWSGNRMTDSDGLPVLIDPAVYYGFREMDLAMTRLFGGFDRQWEAEYHVCFPLAPGFEERIDLCNLYPLLVHVVLFGGGYAMDFMRGLRYYAGHQ